MSELPTTPAEFFTRYLPERFAKVKASLAGRSSEGSMVFRISGGGEYSLRLAGGELVVASGVAEDPLVQVDLTKDDFDHLLLTAIKFDESQIAGLETQLPAFKALTVDAERARNIRAVTGSVAFVITDGTTQRTIVLTPGKGTPHIDAPDCRLECQLADFVDMQSGKQLAIQLAMSGKIRIVGNAQIPMALNAVLG